MIKTLQIKNFKSIRNLEIVCKRINIFIGEPNTGKSNILESLALFSLPYAFQNIKSIFRMHVMTDLFCDYTIENKIEIITSEHHAELRFENNGFIAEAKGNEENKNFYFKFHGDYNGLPGGQTSGISPFKFYRFTMLDKFPKPDAEFLLPPHGDNLLALFQTNKSLREIAQLILKKHGFKLVLKPHEGIIEIQKEIDEIVYGFPYSLTSDTLQRIIFHIVAMESNKDSIIIFEEPEAHAFPFYTKYLAERIAMDTSNQYFISTHNPYLLLALLEKVPIDDIGIHIIYLNQFQTISKLIEKNKLPEILDLDASIFFNLEHFLE